MVIDVLETWHKLAGEGHHQAIPDDHAVAHHCEHLFPGAKVHRHCWRESSFQSHQHNGINPQANEIVEDENHRGVRQGRDEEGGVSEQQK